MSRINLLPWREERRKEQQKDFLIVLGAVFAAAVLIVYLGKWSLDQSIETQRARNTFLSTNIHQLDDRLARLAEDKKERQKILDQTSAIRSLQGNRPLSPRIFDQLVRSLPDGVYFTALSMRDGVITISGVAPSNSRISSLLRHLNDSQWFADPNLADVKANAGGPGAGSIPDGANTFQLTVKQPGLVAEASAVAAAKATTNKRKGK